MNKNNKIYVAVTSRWFISVINFAVFLTIVSAVFGAFDFFMSSANDFDVIEDILDGVATILIAYGVALEERESIMEIFRLYPSMRDQAQERVDKLCHFYGFGILLYGLIIEILVEVLKIPINIFDIEIHEHALFGIGLVFLPLSAFCLLKHIFLMITLPVYRPGQLESKQSRGDLAQ
ncbi:MAG: hypothetical protein ACXV8O_17220 [Methylobacter sp.]